MSDPLAEIVSLLKPTPSIAKLVTAGGRWFVERADLENPFYCVLLEGHCRLTIGSRSPVTLMAGDFVLVPEIHAFTISSMDPPARGTLPQRLETSPGVFRLGNPDGPIDVRAMVGHCAFSAPDKNMLVSLLPDVIHIHGEDRLIDLARMIHDETANHRAARNMVLTRLLEVLLIEALRSAGGTTDAPGLLRGLSDPQLASALRRIHSDPGGSISVEGLAREAAMSRSTFFDRFRGEVGVAPMEYVANWRMALAKALLLGRQISIAEIARTVGYASTSAFSVAFNRHVGMPPGAFAGRD